MKNKKGFVVSAVLYPLLVLFLAIIMGLLSMTDTRKRILDKMKLEITDNIFDDAACSCDTILAKLNYIIANGTGGSGGDTGSYAYNKLTLNVKTYEAYSDFPVVGNIIGDIAVLSDTPIKNYYVSTSVPKSPQEGTVWIVQDNTSNYYVTSDWNRIGISYVMQYENSKWVLKKSYVYNGESWTMLYYVNLKNGYVDITGTDINAEITKTYDYTGEYQTFTATFSGYYKIELWGAQGGTYNIASPGGNGAYTSGEIYLNAGDILYVYVGGQGSTTNQGKKLDGGWNGGGLAFGQSSLSSRYWGSGGGATDIRIEVGDNKKDWSNFESLKSRIMVAAGGNGALYTTNDAALRIPGAAGGGIYGYKTNVYNNLSYGIGYYGTQTRAGYTWYNYESTVGQGGFGYGGSGNEGTGIGMGGGGGYYGGAGTHHHQDTASGSSYISGFDGCNSISEESTSTNIIHTGNSNHYSNYYFINAEMIDGNGYSWNEAEPDNLKNQPTHDGKSTQIGNSGNGYAKITLKKVEVKTEKDLKNIKEKNTKIYSYSYSGNYQIFKPLVSGTYKIELWGAQGGTYNTSYPGGKGAYTSGEIYLDTDKTYYIYVGGEGRYVSTKKEVLGGWNGGGNTIGQAGDLENIRFWTSGGGATDIRTEMTSSLTTWNENKSLKTRIMVAAGGSGSVYATNDSIVRISGASGGGLIGYTSDNYTGQLLNNINTYGMSSVGTQTMPGYTLYFTSAGSKRAGMGGFGYGGSGLEGNGSALGAGSGWYGGGGTYHHQPTTSGTSYISGHDGCNSIDENGIHTGSSISYTGLYFSNTQMVDGRGYNWTDILGSYVGTPTHEGTKRVAGNTGDGYAKITLISTKNTTNNIEEKEYKYTLSETYQVLNVNKSGYYKIELWGAQGGYSNNTYYGGYGAYTSGTIYLNPTTTNKLYIYVGGKGYYAGNQAAYINGGFNGGGNSMGQSGQNRTWGAGGGATDIRTVATSDKTSWNETNSLLSRIMVAAGGSGAIYTESDKNSHSGASGGGLVGSFSMVAGATEYGTKYYGTQTSGGYTLYNKNNYSIGGFGYGGSGGNTSGFAGGGSGWYGGTGGYHHESNTSGSSYISGHAGCIAVTSSGSPKTSTYSTINDSVSWTGYKFQDTIMIDGNSYEWKTEKKDSVSIPKYDSSTFTVGNTGDGYARITYLGE